jgi:hypothetical protein
MESSNSANTHMLYNTNTSSKKFFGLFSSCLLAVILLTSLGSNKTYASNIPKNTVAVAKSNPSKPSRNVSKSPKTSPSGAIEKKIILTDYIKRRS